MADSARRWRTGLEPAGLGPTGLGTLVATEGFERLAYCGTQLLLALYLAALLRSDTPDGRATAQLFAALLGHRDPIAMTAQVMALFFAGTHLATLAGAALARVVDRRAVVAGGTAMMTAGHLAVAEPALLPVGLLLLMAGAGCTVSNKLTQVGLLPLPPGAERAQAFATYAVGLNAGVLFAPLVCGTLGELWGWAWGFRAAAVSMALGLVCYLIGWRSLPREAVRPAPPTTTGGVRWGAVAVALLPYVVAVAVVNQAYTLVLVWAGDGIDRHVLGFAVPLTWLLTVDALAAIAALLLVKTVWRRQAVAGRAADELGRVALGCGVLALAYLWLSQVAAMPGAALVAVIGFFLLLELAVATIDVPMEAWLARRGAGDPGMRLAAFKASGAAGALLLGWLGQFYQPLGPTGFWLLNAALAGGALLAVLALRWRWREPRQCVVEPVSAATAAATSDWR